MTRRITKPRAKPTQIGDDLEKLAKNLLDEANGKADQKPIDFTDKVSCFKAVSNYYAMKNKLELPNESSEEPFNGWAKSLANHGTNGRRRGQGDDPADDPEE